MKKIYPILFSAILLLNGCISDDGNYDYTPLKEVSIEGIADSYRFILQEHQKITPKITTEIASDNLAYCWRIGSDTLSTASNFDYTFTNVLASKDPLTFEVIDLSTNVRYAKRIEIAVVSPFQSGWMVFSVLNNAACLSFQSYEDKKLLYEDVYQEINGEALAGSPLLVKQLRYQDGSTGAYKDRISVLCKDGNSVELDGSSLLRVKNYGDEFRPGGLQVQNINAEYYGNDYSLFMIHKGKIYAKLTGSMGTPEDAYYQYPLEGDTKDYQVGAQFTKPHSDYYVMLDELNHRYVYFNRSSLSTIVSPLSIDEAASTRDFDSNDVKGTSVWMGQSKDQKALSIIKTPAGKYVLDVMTSTYAGIFTLVARYEFPDGTINDESCFAPHRNIPYLLIGTGNQLKALNLEALSAGAGALNNIATYEGRIAAMQYAYDINKNIDEFGIAITGSNTERSGSLLIINPTLTSGGEILKRYDHVGGKIISICRKIM